MSSSASGTFKGRGKNQTTKQRMDLFQARKKGQILDLREINDLTLRTAIGVVTTAGGTLSFSSAAGGRGLMVKVYLGDQYASDYAGNGEEANELLDMVIDQMGSSSEDSRLSYTRSGEGRPG